MKGCNHGPLLLVLGFLACGRTGLDTLSRNSGAGDAVATGGIRATGGAMATGGQGTGGVTTAVATGVSDITAGDGYTCAVANGGVRCWGSNSVGELGDGTTAESRPTAVQVQGLTSGATAVAAGTGHACAIVNGAVQCWGIGRFG